MRWTRIAAASLVVSLVAGYASGQTASGPKMTEARPRLGMNLSGLCDWNTELPFVDVFRLARAWISQREGAGWGKGPELKLDEHGWIRELEPGCFAETPICTIEGGHYPSGKYVVLYDGEGEIELVHAAKVADRRPGRLVVEVDASKGGFFLQIRKTSPGNHIRNIRMIMPGFEESYAKETFHPTFVKRWHGVTCFRFMDWMDTNGSKIAKWEDRPKMDDAVWTVKGAPVELMVDLCNRQKADGWFCMPHLADDDYVRNFARYVKEHLDPKLKAYVEYSNEVWNGMFESNRYAARKGKELGLGDASRPWEGGCMYYGKRSVEIFDIWTKEFGGSERIVRVLAWQAASGTYWLDGMLLAKVDAKKVDALAIAPYITFLPPGQSKEKDALTADVVAKWTVEQVMEHCRTKALPECAKWMRDAAAVAKKYNVKLVCYEAGQHLVGVGGGENNEQLTRLFTRANADPAMGELYRQYFKEWESAGGDLLNHFSSVSKASKWGNWGLIEYDDQGPADSPKLKATMEWGSLLRSDR